MNSGSPCSIVIIGGGFCGVMTFVNLLDKINTSASITIINKGNPLGRGVAYQTYSDLHLLNVEARNMSAFYDQPNHFVEWCYRQNDIKYSREELPTMYLPRNVYGRYIDEILESKIMNVPSNISLHIIEDEVTEIDKIQSHYVIRTSGGNHFHADIFVLATGNNEPGHPVAGNHPILKSRNYFSNPWCVNAVHGLKDNEDVLIIGSGLTMVDVILGLKEKKHSGKIYSLSPHGYSILPHRKLPPQRYILDELTPPFDIESLFRLFYKHVRLAKKSGLPGETVVDAIRAKTQEIWQLLTLADKKKFMTHLRHMWGVARHRLPGYVHEDIQEMIRDKKLEVIAGRIQNISENKDGIKVRFRRRKDQFETEVNVARIINCTGPEADLRKQNGTLYENLLKKGIIQPDEMNLGIHSTAEGQIIDASNKISNQAFALGSLLKGKLWESTAIPELRVQAHKVAELISKSMTMRNSQGTALNDEKRLTFGV